MRYAIIEDGLSTTQIAQECRRLGGRNIKVAAMMKQVFCDLDAAAVEKLKLVPGLIVEPVDKVQADAIALPDTEVPTPIPPELVYYSVNQFMDASGWMRLRTMFSPPLTGVGSTIVILDTGIRKTHESLKDKVVYEANFSSSPTLMDVFNHGTGVAYMAAGGEHGADAGVAPGASLWNIKVLNDDGSGTEEGVVLGLEHVMEKRKEAMDAELSMHDPMRPSMLNLSLGAPDTGDPNNPLRVACRECTKLGMAPAAAAGNAGPGPGTIMSPASDPMVIAIGALTCNPFAISEYSSRGPTKEGLTKPDFCCYGVSVRVASAVSDTDYVVKSGTSFSCPMLAGLAALAVELPLRCGEEFMPEPNCVQMVVDSVVKPQGAELGQDNSYGWGMPWGQYLAQYFQPALAVDLSLVVPILGLGIAGMMMGTMVKALK